MDLDLVLQALIARREKPTLSDLPGSRLRVGRGDIGCCWLGLCEREKTRKSKSHGHLPSVSGRLGRRARGGDVLSGFPIGRASPVVCVGPFQLRCDSGGRPAGC